MKRNPNDVFFKDCKRFKSKGDLIKDNKRNTINFKFEIFSDPLSAPKDCLFLVIYIICFYSFTKGKIRLSQQIMFVDCHLRTSLRQTKIIIYSRAS